MKNAKSTSTSKPEPSKPEPRKTGRAAARSTDLRADRTDWTRVRAMSDADVEAAIRSDRDEAGMKVDWSRAKIVRPERKRTMTIRLDGEVLDFYRGMGRGYQTTINAVLRSYMEHAKS